ncbi:MAG TPA: tubulin-like doman-containing protein [Thermoanaerobaculia bacterium]|jgi:hypothetical protein|nr:tubulin-like doman-containing protein [Thermoanaerobaculia bacterium]
MSIATLIIGLGGTGIQTLRALKRLYSDLPKEERVPASFLGIDFDRSAVEAGDRNDQLDSLGDDEFLYLDPRSIQEALRHLDREQAEQPSWSNVLEWFPERIKIPVSEVEANGASQLRVLGRLGFFLHDEAISRALRGKLHQLGGEVDPLRLSEEKRVILVSSIAGGTGAGMMIDVAYLARRQMGRPKVYAFFLLPEVFQDVDGGGRILQNAYASIQELCHLKDQQIPIRARYFHLPPLDVPVHGEEPFARLFLCPSEGFCGTDAIRDANLRLAGSILGQLQRTIQERTLAVVANTVSADPAQEQSRRRTHCFSTVGSQFIQLTRVEKLDDAVFDAAIRALHQPAFLAALFDEEVSATSRHLEEVLRADSEPVSTAPLAPNSEEPVRGEERNLVRSWRGRIERDAEQARDQLCSNLAEQLKLIDERLRAGRTEDLQSATERLAQLGDLILNEFNEDSYEKKLALLRQLTIADPKDGTPLADGKTLFDKLDQRLRDEIRSHVSTAERALGEGAIKRKAFIEKLLEDPSLFRYSFPESKSAEITAAGERRLRRSKIAADQFRRRWWQRLASNRLTKILTARRDLGDLSETLADPTFRTNLEAILRVRTIKALRIALEQRLEEANRALPGEAVWESLSEGELIGPAKIDQLPAPLRLQVRTLLRASLSSLVDDAREFASEKDPEVRRKRLLGLVQTRLRNDRVLGKNQQVLEWEPKDVETRLREALVRVRQRVFERRTPNVLRKGFALIMVPEGLVWPRGDREDLFEFLAASASQILNSQVQVEDYRGSRIWIYAEDLFNPPDHIRNLDDYYQAYQASEFVELYHIDRRFLKLRDFRDIRTTASVSVASCGNDSCIYSIANVPATTRTCPGCNQPIRSRCGNSDCLATELHKHPRRHDKSCPFCQGFNHAAWWVCCRHGEIPEEISIDKELCPRCIEKHQQDPLAFPESRISQRPDVREAVFCPRCEDLHAQDQRHPIFRVPADLICFYRDGVNGHDAEEFETIAARHHLPDRVRCPNCRTLLIPVDHAAGRTCCAAEETRCPTH